MTDRELLELAAKAAGYKMNIVSSREQGGTVTFYMEPSNLCWNPLTDDGDALRLAVKLNIRFLGEWGGKAVAFNGILEHKESNSDDPYAATRRAIVRAAAEIGRAMKEEPK